MYCKFISYVICGFHNCADEDSGLLGYDALAVNTWQLLAEGMALYLNYSFACLQGDRTASHHIVC